jgi:Domain of unknown function (DUF4388)
MDSTIILIISTGFVSGLAGGVGVLFLITMSRRKPIIEQPYKTSFAFSGNLRQTPLLDAIQFLEIGRREGILHIYCGRRKGYLIFVKGQVVDAFYRNFMKREAVFAMLDLSDGDFYFEPKAISQPKLITDTFMDLAFEWDARKSAKSGQPDS